MNNNLLIVPDKILNQQICTKCLKYLSVGPVVLCSGKVLCGRCTTVCHATKLKHSQYNFLANAMVFKCINHYAGCDELLFFNEATEHEKTCKKNMIKLTCPFCTFDGSGYQLIHHFVKEHERYFVEEDVFKIGSGDQQLRNIILVKSSHIFCMTILVRHSFIDIFNLLVTSDGPKHFQLKFFRTDSCIQFVTAPIQVTTNFEDFPKNESVLSELYNVPDPSLKRFRLDRSMIFENCFPSGKCFCKIKLINKTNCDSEATNLFVHKMVSESDYKLPASLLSLRGLSGGTGEDLSSDDILKMSLSDLRRFVTSELNLPQYCVNCSTNLTYWLTYFFCPKYHMACEECTNKKCSICKTFCNWTNKTKVHHILLRCEWSGCVTEINIFEYIKHKRDCKFRKYKCPDVDCNFIGTLNSLKHHWHMTPIMHDYMITISVGDCAFYWVNICTNEMFYVSVEFIAASGKLTVTINEYDVIMHKRYEFQFLFKSKNERNFTKTDISKKHFDLFYGNECIRFVKFLDNTLSHQFRLSGNIKK